MKKNNKGFTLIELLVVIAIIGLLSTFISMKKNNKGFTLIELLVVIAIIGLLSTLSIVALNNARARSRDARRVSDIKQMQTALELYFNDVGTYPSQNIIASATIANGSVTYMKTVPTPPTPNDGNCSTTTNTYAYTQTGTNGSSYNITYCVGQTITNGPTGGIIQTATPAGIK
ncbi:MAG: prepilin-type N-terminal cleavage/methylation domain-containing protein [Candidatus Falkowbacteria bacterium]|nr:prepilin-type N-terminal cleavage/methylation domain-containing protein [Candidatus Falkowbacteria bacterium]